MDVDRLIAASYRFAYVLPYSAAVRIRKCLTLVIIQAIGQISIAVLESRIHSVDNSERGMLSALHARKKQRGADLNLTVYSFCSSLVKTLLSLLLLSFAFSVVLLGCARDYKKVVSYPAPRHPIPEEFNPRQTVIEAMVKTALCLEKTYGREPRMSYADPLNLSLEIKVDGINQSSTTYFSINVEFLLDESSTLPSTASNLMMLPRFVSKSSVYLNDFNLRVINDRHGENDLFKLEKEVTSCIPS